ncbi:CRISPR-associated helicase Cas3' [Campylobacter sp. RM12327]|uniref:CRISPR-associated helicase Cas3' n=1 Tax=Campylobacter sputorum TaxID=206 RepID=UPI000B77E8A8|nr:MULTISPECIES: CRISPR-associated helicase Cas3' [unclassified Campylobacter]MBE7358747.1 CRISPR-associated helicase Cas3' [Campylobacter sp. RM11302]MBF6670069.1 CRISPR-associated helicase Cas3' [Campylobacter sp. RM12327]MBF6675197.1 CRISPR-associated helicase Cas3' [Campylobacter sp. RM13538]MBF6676809.1 CRISPR-associated helicase Cas3' [Campylobacter sp. RM12321]MBF6678545.1 CRISPR-associated helicase Cas3' [Campylobacter sp. RM11259]
MTKDSILFDEFLSHPNKIFINHILGMLYENDATLEKQVKIYHDIAKLKNSFQIYIRDKSKVKNKEHSLLSGYFFVSNSDFDQLDTLFGFLAIISHHTDVKDFYSLKVSNKNFGDYYQNSIEFSFANEVIENAKTFSEFKDIKFDNIHEKAKKLSRYLLLSEFKHKFNYDDFIKFKSIYSNLIFNDKFEAIFSSKFTPSKPIQLKPLEKYIKNLVKDEDRNLPENKKREDFRQFVLSNFDKNHSLYTLTAPTGYGKTLTALNFALKFKKERVIFTLPFTSIIDQTYDTFSKIYPDLEVQKIHHKTIVQNDENEDIDLDSDRYSKVKFMLNSFSADINITTMYQLIYAMFGNSNKDNVKFHSLKNSVIIVDEAQALPYKFRQDFIKLCEIISEKLNSVFILMSATMPVINSPEFKEISNLDYFKKQNRYKIKYLDKDEDELIEQIKIVAKDKHTLVVVNTIKKAQELYFKFQDEFKTYSINGYMTDNHKLQIIGDIKKRLKNKNDKSKKILLISTQSIEAGVDLSFEVGFREISPISSIIQTAGRVNRSGEFGDGVLYVFNNISKFEALIYGDLQNISDSIFKILKQKEIKESEILEFSNIYFKKIHENLENLYIENEISKLEFETINSKIDEIMKENRYKKLIIIEPKPNFISDLEQVFFNYKNDDEFKIKEFRNNIIKKIIKYGVNISQNDIKNFGTRLEKVKFCDISYLPFNAPEYDKNVGILKANSKEMAFS